MPGGRSAANTVRYTAVAPVRLDDAREALQKPAVSHQDHDEEHRRGADVNIGHMPGDRYGHRSDQAAQDARATAPQRLYESHDKEPPNDRDQAHPYHQIGSLGPG